jgi:cysteinyl-tRNA synthetase
LDKAEAKIADALNDDFNTPEAMAALYEVMRLFNNLCRTPGKVNPEQQAVAEVYWPWLKRQGEIMALFQEEPVAFLKTLDDMILKKRGLTRESIEQLVVERSRARTEKNYSRSDELRAELTKMGVLVADTAAGSSWEVDKTQLQ